MLPTIVELSSKNLIKNWIWWIKVHDFGVVLWKFGFYLYPPIYPFSVFGTRYKAENDHFMNDNFLDEFLRNVVVA